MGRISFLWAVILFTARTPLQAARDVGKLYAELCAGCHGAGLEGGKAVSLIDDEWKHGSDDASIARAIREGIPLSGMPGFAATVNAAETRALVVFIRETAVRATKPTPKKAEALPEGIQRSEVQDYRIESFAEGLDVPWSIAFLPEGRVLVTERAGRLRVIEKGKLQPEPVAGVPPVWVHDEGGLLSVVPHPDYAHNGWIYLSFSDPGLDPDAAMTKVVRGRLRDGRFVDQQTILAFPRERYPKSGMNFGCRLVFDGAYLFISVGERGQVGQAQDVSLPNGKIHRVYHDGTVPPDNPLANRPGACPSIWSYGHRNPQGLARDPVTGELWETEHGPRGGDELNHILAGRNYGWPVITYGMNYDGTPIADHTAQEGMEQPVLYWTPSIATCPIMFYAGDKFPRWKHQLFLGSLAQQEFRRIVIEGDRVIHQELVFKNIGRVRDIQTGPDGLIYVALEPPGVPGRIVRLVPVEQSQP